MNIEITQPVRNALDELPIYLGNDQQFFDMTANHYFMQGIMNHVGNKVELTKNVMNQTYQYFWEEVATNDQDCGLYRLCPLGFTVFFKLEKNFSVTE